MFSRIPRWLRKITNRRKPNHASRPVTRRALLSLERLEDRTVPSTFTVTNLADSGDGSLRAAITAANNSAGADVIQFAGELKGTITLTSTNGELSITDDLTIDGPGANKLTVSGDGVTRVFHVSGSATDLSIDGLTVANGLASVPAGPTFGGGLLNDGANVSLSKVVFANNQAQSTGGYAGGGAVANLGGAHLTADQTDFLDNSANGASTNFGNGGAVYDDQHSVVDIEQSTFSGNLATAGNANGGAIAHYGGSQLTLGYCSFASNQVLALPPGSALAFGGFGGAIQSDQDESGFFGDLGQPTMTITHCSFTGNQVHVVTPASGGNGGLASGGALELEDNAKATVSYSTFDRNLVVAGDGGAGGAGQGGGSGGTANGGAIAGTSAILSVSNSRFNGNEAHAGTGGQGGSGGRGGAGGLGQGGAIFATFSTNPVEPLPVIMIAHCQFVGNGLFGGDGGAGGSGGNGGSGGLTNGGGILHRGGTITVSDSSIVGNTAQGGAGGAPGSGAGTVGGDGGLARGGGFSNERGGAATLTHTSIINNQAIGGAGGAGGNGGNAVGGGVYNGRVAGAGPFPTQPATLEMIDCTVSTNLVMGGAGGVGGNGGYALGGGICNANTTATGGLITSDPYPILDLDGTNVTGNQAVGGAAGAGGVDGVGVGGGLYNQTGAIAEVDAFSLITGNKASTSDDDIFGTVIPI